MKLPQLELWRMFAAILWFGFALACLQVRAVEDCGILSIRLLGVVLLATSLGTMLRHGALATVGAAITVTAAALFVSLVDHMLP